MWTFNLTFNKEQQSSASVSMSPVVDGDGAVYIATGLGVLYKLGASRPLLRTLPHSTHPYPADLMA